MKCGMRNAEWKLTRNSSLLIIVRECDNFGASVFLTGNYKVLNQRLERALQKRVQARVGVGCQPRLSQLGGDGVEVFLGTAVSVTASRQAANVAVEFGRNVPQLVRNCSQTFREIVEIKPGQIEIEQIQSVGAGSVLNLLDDNLMSPANSRSFSIWESKRGQRGVHSVFGIVARLTESDSNPIHINMI